MDFEDTPEEAAYRLQVKAWLAEYAPKASALPLDEAERLSAARVWQARKAEAGYARITWPKAWGGAGGTAIQQVVFDQEEAHYAVPVGFFGIGLGMCVPTVMKYADESLRQRFVGPALRGEEIWCQLFSEPAAGSDVAGVRTRAVREGEGPDAGWRVSGQKVWTSGAHYADFGLLLARTDPGVPKHRGLTMFWIDMRAPGVDVRPIRQMTGGADFNEVYLDEVRVPDAQRLGAIGKGWEVAIFTLMNERVEGGKLRGPSTDSLLDFARNTPFDEGTLLDDPGFRERLATWFVQSEGLKYTRYRTMTALSRGVAPGPEASIGKLLLANRQQDMSHEMIEHQDQFGLICDAEFAPGAAALHHDFLQAPGLRVAGGTDEILLNIIAERVLGMPPDIRVDKDKAFNDLPRGR